MPPRQRSGTGGGPAGRTLPRTTTTAARPQSRPRSREREREKNAVRQATRRREADAAPRPPAPRRRIGGRLTRRAAVLALLVCALVLSLAYPLKHYLGQRSQIAQLAEQNAQKQAAVDALERRKAQLKDPAYITMLARQRLQYVIPGERQMVVVQQGQGGSDSDGSGKHHAGSDAPWYGQLWGSVQQADRAP